MGIGDSRCDGGRLGDAGRADHDLATSGIGHSDRVSACWGGDFYAVRPIEAMGIDRDKGVVRMSATHYTSADDVARLIAALDRVL